MKKRTEESVTKEIVERHKNGKDLTHKAIRKEDPALEGAATKFFGGWCLALEASGFDPEDYRKQKPFGDWTKERVIEEICRLNQCGEDLIYSRIRNEDHALESAATHLFGGWYSALDAAGIDSNKYRKRQPNGYWTESRIIQEIQNRREKGLELSMKRSRDDCPSLPFSAIRLFGSWDKALEAAGFDPAEHRIRVPAGLYSKEYLVKEIQELESKGEDIGSVEIRKKRPELVKGIFKTFGSYRALLEAAGFDPNQYTELLPTGYWTQQRIIAEIQKLADSKNDLSYNHMQKNQGDLLAAAVSRFGSWANAVRSSGVEYDLQRKIRPSGYWTSDQVIQELRRLDSAGAVLTASSVREHSGPLVKYAFDFFGGWYNALAAAEISIDELRKQGRIMTLRKWTHDDVVGEIKEWKLADEDLSYSSITARYSALVHGSG